MQQTTVIPQLQSIDKVVDVSLVQVQQIPGAVCEKTVAIPQLQLVFFPGRSQLVVVRLVQTSENCAGPQLQFERGRCPCCAGAQRCCRCSSCGMDVPVIMQRRWFATALVGRACAQAQGQGRPPPSGREGWRGRRESDSQVTCHPIHCMLLESTDKHTYQGPRPHHHHHHQGSNRFVLLFLFVASVEP